MNVLLLARIDSIFTTELVNNLSKKDISFDLIDISHLKFVEFKKNKKIEKLLVPPILAKNIFIRYAIGVFVVYYFLLNHKKKYDFCHMLYKKLQYFFLIDLLKSKYPKVALSIYGSDFYKSNIKYYDKYIYERVDYITFANIDTYNNFSNYYKKKYDYKSKICTFGIDHLDVIDTIMSKETKNESKKHFGLNPDQITVVCGTNGTPNDQHENIIKSISEADLHEYLNKITLIFPFTNGASAKRIKKIKNLINNNLKKYNILFLETYLNDEDLARLRIISDILINVRKTDQFSAVMTETMYSGGTVITGDWLPYNILKENNVFFVKIKNIQELSNAIKKSLVNINMYKIKQQNNRNKIYKLCHWNTTNQQWYKLYFDKSNSIKI